MWNCTAATEQVITRSSPLHSQRSLRRAWLCGLVLAAGTASRVPAQLPDVRMWRVADTSATVALSIASSGGVSIGAYQAGAAWMLVELLNAMRGDEAFRGRYNLPHYELANWSGSSAGGINALLAALRWCAPTRRERAEESSFWELWNEIGIEQLSPEQRGPEDRELGLFERSVLRRTIERRVNEEIASATGPCALPLAVLASKLTPGRLPLNPLLTADVQRYVAVYVVKSQPTPDGGTRIAITPAPPFVQRDTALGKQLVLPASGADEIGIPMLLQLLTASSSVAYLFAPVSLQYCDATRATASGGCGDGHTEPSRSRFVDGGAIDNAPLYAGLRLLAIDDSLAIARMPHERAAASGVILISYGARRHASPRDALGIGSRPSPEPHTICKRPDDPEHCGGLGALTQFLSGLIQSGSQYELQWLIRLRAQDSVLRSLDIDLITRHPNIVGERLRNSAAFLGRPFRESDFHSGMYDALHYLASGVLCQPEHRPAASSSNDEDCVVRAVDELMALVPLSCVSTMTVRGELASEYPDATIPTPAACRDPGGGELDRVEAYRAVKRALEASEAPAPDQCAKQGTVAAMLCRAGMTQMFDLLRQDPRFSQYAKSQYDTCRDSIAHTADTREQELIRNRCFVDDDFMLTLAHPKRGLFRRMRFVLDRMQWLEEEVETQEGGATVVAHWDAGTQFLNFFGRSALLSEDPGWIAFPTVVPRRNNPWRIATGLLMPGEAEVQLLGKAWALNWRPLAYRATSGVVVEWDVGWIRNAFATPNAPEGKLTSPWRLTSQLIAGYRPRARGRLLLSSVAAGVRYWRPSALDQEQGASMFARSDLSPVVRADILWDRFGLSATTTPAYAAPRDRRRLRVSVTVNDGGGAIYWLLRSRNLR